MKRIIVSLLASLALGACGGSGTTRVGVSVRTGPAASGAAQPQLAQRLQLANGIELTRVVAVVRRLELEREDARDAGSDGGTGEGEVELGPFLVELTGAALLGGEQQVLQVEVPGGVYEKIKLDIRPLSSGEDRADPDFAEMVARGASLLVEGSVDGTPFTIATGLRLELERRARFELSGGTHNLTLDLDLAGWFASLGGGRLDPSDPAQLALIEAAIRRSIDVFDDRDHDGREDRDDDGGGSHGADDPPGDDHGGRGRGSDD